MARPAKPSERRQNRATGSARSLRLVTGDATELVVPSGEAGWSERTVVEWEAFWLSDVARLSDPVVDVGLVREMFGLLDRAGKLWAVFDAAPFSENRSGAGAGGAVSAHPAGKLALAMVAEARQLAKQVGVTAKARLGLGVRLGEAARSLAQLAVGGDEKLKVDDPRTVDI